MLLHHSDSRALKSFGVSLVAETYLQGIWSLKKQFQYTGHKAPHVSLEEIDDSLFNAEGLLASLPIK